MENNSKMLDELRTSLDGFIPAVSDLGLGVRLENGYKMEDIADLYESIDWICKGVLLTANIHGIDIHSYEFPKKLTFLLSLTEAKDDVQIADVIEYEILPALTDIQNRLFSIR